MPGFDGTGPWGMGPMTGGGRGFCNPWGRSFGRGFGRGYGRGLGLGFRGRWGVAPAGPAYGYYNDPYAYSGPMTKEEELDFLHEQAQTIKQQLEQIEQRMSELEK